MIETQPRPTIRTIVASFLFTDLVGFSKGTASDQYAAKARLSGVLRRYLAALKASDYWIKDTGDGALIAFVSNPEHALYMALALGHEYGAGEDAAAGILRTGLHLGTVKESIDVEARRNFIGDGINAAKRIMDFALPGQMTASRSFFEAIANLDAAYAALFQHGGAPDDKHGRAHELYTLSPSDSVLERLRADLAAEAASVADGPAANASAAAAASAGSTGRRARIRRPVLILAAVVAGIASIALTTQVRERWAQEMLPPAVAPKSTPEASAIAPQKAGDLAAPSPAVETEIHAPPSSAPAADSVARRVAPSHVETTERAANEGNRAASAPGAATRGAAEAKPRVAAPAATADVNGASGPRCSRIVEKAALGEPLTPEEKRELANSCR